MATDDPIPAEDWLYRSADPATIVDDSVLIEAIEMPNCSFAWSRLVQSRDDCKDMESRPTETRVIGIQPRNLPDPITRSTDKAVFDFSATHQPIEDPPEERDPAHSEIRLACRGGTFTRNIRKNSVFMAEALRALAARMKVDPPNPESQAGGANAQEEERGREGCSTP